MDNNIVKDTTESISTMKNNVVLNSKNEIVAALKSKFATSVNRVYINSLDAEVGFREITVAEQKSLSRIMIDNEKRRDIIYDSQCAIINKTCLNDGFDIYQLSEFDKIKLQMALYQSNVTKTDVSFKCSECGTDNTYKLDFTNTMKLLDEMDISDRDFKYSDRFGTYIFKVGYPKCLRVSQLFKNLVTKYKKTLNESGTDTNINMDYIMLFIKSITIDRNDGETLQINLDELSASDVSDIFESFP